MEQNKDMYNHFATEARKAGYASIGDAIRTAAAAKQAQPVATFDGYDGESLKPVFTLIGTLNAGDKLCVCAPAQAAAPSDIEELFKEALGTVALHDLADARAIGAKYQKLARQQAAPVLPANVKLAGVKMANTMFNLAQRAGEAIDSDLCSKMDAMRKEWDSALFVSYGAAAAQPAPQALLDHAHADPTGWMCPGAIEPEFTADALLAGYWMRKGRTVVPLYTAVGEVSQGAAPTAADVRNAALEEAATWLDSYDGKGGRRAEAIRALRAAQPNMQEAGK